MTVTTNNQTNGAQQQQQQQQQLEAGVDEMTSKSPLPAAVIDVPRDVIKTFPHTKRVGSYLIGKTLGEGSFAKVKEGIHYPTSERVAIKVVDKKRAKEDMYVRRNMRREGKILQQVHHPNIVSLYEIMETENSYYLVTELCRGGEFMEYICRRKSLEEAEVRRYMRQIISAVDYLHRLGIMHRDLKVENLLLDENHDIKIIDFGLSNSFRSAAAGTSDRVSNLFRPDEVLSTQCGSPAYAAPELLGKKRYGPPADVWSIGVNMYAMLTGNLPFTVEPFNIKALHYKMLNGDMNALPDRVSKDCKDFLKRILNPDPEKRMKLVDAMKHPWLTEGRTKPLEQSPRHTKLAASDIDERILQHMTENQGYKYSDVIKFVSSNVPCAAAAMYKFWQTRLDRSNQQHHHQQQQQQKQPQQQKHAKYPEHQVKPPPQQQQKQTPQQKPQQPSKALLPLTTKTSKATNPTQKLPVMLQGEAFVAPGVRVSINKDAPVTEPTNDLSPPVTKKPESSNKPDIGFHVNTIEMLPRPKLDLTEKPSRPVKSSALVRRALHAMRATSRESRDTKERRKTIENYSRSNDSSNVNDVAPPDRKPEPAPPENADFARASVSSMKPSPMPFPFMTIPAPEKKTDEAQTDAPAQASQTNNITGPERHTGMQLLDNYRDWSHLGTNKMLAHRHEQGQGRTVVVSNKNTLPKGTTTGNKYAVANTNICLNDLNKDTVNNRQQSRLDQQRTSYSPQKQHRNLAARMSAPATRMRRRSLTGSEQGEPPKVNNPFLSPNNGYVNQIQHSNLVEKAEKLLNNINSTLDNNTNKAKSNNVGSFLHNTANSSKENTYLNRINKKLIDVTLAPYVPRTDPKIVNDNTSGSLNRKPEVDSGIELGHLSATKVAERHRGDTLNMLVNDHNNNVFGVTAFPVTMFKKTDLDSEPTSDLSLSPFTPPESMNGSKSPRSGGSRGRSTHSRINGTYDLILPTLAPAKPAA